MKRFSIYAGIIVLLSALGFQVAMSMTRGELDNPFPAPDFTGKNETDWINSPPLAMEDLKGKVVLVDFWTFECWNCFRSFPWLNAMEERLKDRDFQVIGIHSPEFEREKVRASIVAKAAEFELHHPIMIDNEHYYWRAMKNRYWPAFYLIDKKGLVRAVFVGETHEGDLQAKQIEKTIVRLLEEAI